MRQLRHVILNLGLAFAVVAPVAVATDAVADARSEARTHYQAGVKFYSGGDYKSAIREFSAAQNLAPADLNNYNLALCYDKLGEAEPAVQYYKAYLDKVPNTDKRAEIEASMQRLDAALKSSAAKKAEEARKADEAKKAIDLKKAEDDKRKADEDAKRKVDEDAKKTDDAKITPDETPKIGPIAPGRPGRPGVGSTGTPGTGNVQPTGDNQIDRVNQINIDQIRDERVGGSSSGIADRKRPPSNAGPVNPRVGVNGGAGGGEPAPNAAPTDPRAGAGTQGPVADPNTAPTDKPKQVPVYKKWWFWAVVAVSAYVVYSIASEDSKQSGQARTMLPPPGPAGQSGGGMTLWRF